MAGPDYPGLDTLALHAGAQPDPATGARATPIYQSASFCVPDSDYAASRFNIERAGHVYSRLSNPTNAVLEERIAALAAAKESGDDAEGSKKPLFVKYGINHITKLCEEKKAQLVCIAPDHSDQILVGEKLLTRFQIPNSSRGLKN